MDWHVKMGGVRTAGSIEVDTVVHFLEIRVVWMDARGEIVPEGKKVVK